MNFQEATKVLKSGGKVSLSSWNMHSYLLWDFTTDRIFVCGGQESDVWTPYLSELESDSWEVVKESEDKTKIRHLEQQVKDLKMELDQVRTWLEQKSIDHTGGLGSADTRNGGQLQKAVTQQEYGTSLAKSYWEK